MIFADQISKLDICCKLLIVHIHYPPIYLILVICLRSNQNKTQFEKHA